MKKSLKTTITTSIVAIAAVLMAVFVPVTTFAACDDLTGAEYGACLASDGTGQQAELLGPNGVVTNIINWALIAIGFLAVIMLIYGGVRYTISAGDAKQVEAAKNTIMYAIIGLIVALLAAAVVNFVLAALVSKA